MKKINLRGLSEVLSEKELKNVLGGSGGPPWYEYKCKAEKELNSTQWLCTIFPEEAEKWAGEDGWWCCNCDEAIRDCG